MEKNIDAHATSDVPFDLVHIFFRAYVEAVARPVKVKSSISAWPAVFPIALVGQAALAQNAVPEAPADNEIIVTAPSGDQKRTDRQVYIVKDNAQAQTETGLQLLRHVPSVTVDSDDQVQLLGDPKVKVLIDGHPVTSNSRALKSLPAGQIARVEVMTNPSAAYSAEGTAGVINIITRQVAKPGLGGAATVTRGGFGGIVTKIAPTIAAGPWSASLAFSYDNSGFRNDVTQQRTADDPAQRFSARRHNDAPNNDFGAHAEINYKPEPSTAWTLTLDHLDSQMTALSRQDTLSRGSALFPLVRATRSFYGDYNDSASLAYSWVGKREGENLTASLTFSDTRVPLWDRVAEDYGASSQFTLLQHDETTRSGELKIDYVHPFKKADILSIGGSVVRADKFNIDGLSASGVNIVSLPFGPARIGGLWTTTSAYTTLQFPIGKWTILPGARIENRDMDAPDLGPAGRHNDLFFFPSFHADRQLTKRLSIAFSYSRRVEWPRLRQLDPLIQYFDPLDGASGNPRLRPQLTKAFEGSLGYKLGKQTINLKLYDRQTSNAWLDTANLLPNGVSLTTVANIGSLRKLGGEFSAQGAFGRGWHYNVSIDLLARRSTFFANGATFPRNEFTYSGNAQVEYQDKADGKPGSNHFELAVQYLGPSNSFQTRTSSYTIGSLSWTHSFNARLSTVLKADDLFSGDGITTTVVGAGYRQITNRLDDKRRVMASLVCRLGRLR